MSFATMIPRTVPDGDAVLSIPFPRDTEGYGLVHYVITRKAPLRRGMPARFLVFLVLTSDGLCLNDNLPVDCRESFPDAVARATVGFDEAAA